MSARATAWRAASRRVHALALLGWALVACGAPPDDEPWVTLAREDWPLGVEVTGTLKATVSDTLGPPQVANTGEYKIARMAPEGAQVKRGQEVLAFDTSGLERQLLERQNERDAAAAEIARALTDAQLRRKDEQLAIQESEGAVRKAALKAEGDRDSISSLELRLAQQDHELEQRRLVFQKQRALATQTRDREDIEALRAKKVAAEERVKDADDAIRRMTLLAPRDATVIYLTNWQGQKKKVGDGVWRGETVLETAVIDAMFALGEVAEADISRLSVGQRVTLRLEAHPDTEYTGRVSAIGNVIESPSAQSPLRIVRATLVLDASEPLRMRPGMRFSGTIETERLSSVLRMPLGAVFLRPAGPVAYRRLGGGFEQVHLTLGRAHREFVEVRAGLREGDQVALSDLEHAAEPQP